MPGFTALKGRISKILEVSGHEVKHTILVPALGLQLVGKSDACFLMLSKPLCRYVYIMYTDTMIRR